MPSREELFEFLYGHSIDLSEQLAGMNIPIVSRLHRERLDFVDSFYEPLDKPLEM